MEHVSTGRAGQENACASRYRSCVGRPRFNGSHRRRQSHPSGRTDANRSDNGQAELNVAHPTGGTGEPDGSGVVKLTVSPLKRQVCYDIQVDDVATPMLAYIHEGPPQRIGPPVVGLLYRVRKRPQRMRAGEHRPPVGHPV